MPRPRHNPGQVRPGQSFATYVALLEQVAQEAYDLVRKMETDRALRHWQPASFATATTYVARIYRALLATILLLDVVDQLGSTQHHSAPNVFTTHHSFEPRTRTVLQKHRLWYETKARVVESLARTADRTPLSEGQWERAFARRLAAATALRTPATALRDRVVDVVAHAAELTTTAYIDSDVYSEIMTLSSLLAAFARTLQAPALADALSHGPQLAIAIWRNSVREAVLAEAADRAENAAIEADARAKGYL